MNLAEMCNKYVHTIFYIRNIQNNDDQNKRKQKVTILSQYRLTNTDKSSFTFFFQSIPMPAKQELFYLRI